MIAPERGFRTSRTLLECRVCPRGENGLGLVQPTTPTKRRCQ